MQIKTTMRDHLILVRMAIIKKSTNKSLSPQQSFNKSSFPHIKKKKSTNNKCWRACGEKGIVLRCWWECKLMQPLWRTVWRLLKKLKIGLPYDPAIPLLGVYLQKTRTLIRKDTCTPMFIAALFTISKTRKQPKCPSTDEWIKKMWCIYTMDYYSAIKKNEIMPFAAIWMYLEIIILGEVNQTKTNI